MIQGDDAGRIVYIGETDRGGERVRFGIRNSDRQGHLYVVGKTGMGKSTLLENMAIQDIASHRPLLFIDPTGRSVNTLLDYVPEDRVDDVVYISLRSPEALCRFNPLAGVPPEQIGFVVDSYIAAFERTWPELIDPEVAHVLTYLIWSLVIMPNAQLQDLERFMADDHFRQDVRSYCVDPVLCSFWDADFLNLSSDLRNRVIKAIDMGISVVWKHPTVSRMLCGSQAEFSFEEIVDTRHIILVDTAGALLGEQLSSIFANFFLTRAYAARAAAALRNTIDEKHIDPFYIYIDECQLVLNELSSTLFTQSAQCGVSLTLAHQYAQQLPDSVRDIVHRMVGTTISFRASETDAQILEMLYAPTFNREDCASLGFAEIITTLRIDGVVSPPFKAHTLSPLTPPAQSMRTRIMQRMDAAYADRALPNTDIEEEETEFEEVTLPKEFGNKEEKEQTENQASLREAIQAAMSARAVEHQKENEVRRGEVGVGDIESILEE